MSGFVKVCDADTEANEFQTWLSEPGTIKTVSLTYDIFNKFQADVRVGDFQFEFSNEMRKYSLRGANSLQELEARIVKECKL